MYLLQFDSRVCLEIYCIFYAFLSLSPFCLRHLYRRQIVNRREKTIKRVDNCIDLTRYRPFGQIYLFYDESFVERLASGLSMVSSETRTIFFSNSTVLILLSYGYKSSSPDISLRETRAKDCVALLNRDLVRRNSRGQQCAKS